MVFSEGFGWQSEKKKHALRLVFPTSLIHCGEIGKQDVDQMPPHLPCTLSQYFFVSILQSVKSGVFCKNVLQIMLKMVRFVAVSHTFPFQM